MSPDDPFVDFLGCSVLEADPRHAVAQQRPAPELDNHAGVRHAGALFSVGYAASRALVASALGATAVTAEARMLHSEVAYEKVVRDEVVTATAEPAADWEAFLERLSDGEVVPLPTSVTLRNDEGQMVTTMSISWNVTPSQSAVK